MTATRRLENRASRKRRRATLGACAAIVGLASCGTIGTVKGFLIGESGSGPERHLTGFIGGVAADEPQAAIVGREILKRGGDAADAAVATGLALAVTLPSRASLDGGGACVAFTPEHDGVAIASVFLPQPGSGGGAGRPASVPMLARGLFALQDRLGHVRFDELVEPAENLARHGVPVSHLLGDDLSVVRTPLLADPASHAVFTAPDGTPLQENDTLIQTDLGATLDQIRILGPGALVSGPVARAFVSGATLAGGGVTLDDLKNAEIALSRPIELPVNGAGLGKKRHGDPERITVAFVPLPADGGIAAARAFRVLEENPDAIAAAEAEAASTAAYARSSGADADTILAADIPHGTLPALPASTSFVVTDRSGGAVACALTMGNLFGTGRIAPGTGIMLASSPTGHPLPLLPVAIAFNRDQAAFRAAVSASGQNDAAAAAAEALANTLRTRKPIPRSVTGEGRVNVIGCPDLLPGNSQACAGATDERGSGLALGN